MGVLAGVVLCQNKGKYVHDPSGDKALPYKHDATGDTAEPYKHDKSGDKGQPYKHDTSGDKGEPYKHDPSGRYFSSFSVEILITSIVQETQPFLTRKMPMAGKMQCWSTDMSFK